MTDPYRQAQIERYGNAYQELMTALAKYPKAMWQYKPDENQWSIHEMIVHITDSEANSYVRCRRFIAQPNEPLQAYDENLWAHILDYHAQSTEDALSLFRWLRRNSYQLIKDLPATVWAHQAYHPENGIMTMDDWLETYANHVSEHVAQMERVFARWQQTSS